MEHGVRKILKNRKVKEDNTIGRTVTGKVIAINSKDEIIVDIGYKADGIIPRKEYSFNEEDDPKEEIKVGDSITADVLKMNDGVGNVLLSYKKYKARQARKELDEKVKRQEIFEEKISEVIEKGFIVNYNGTRIFIPLSLSGIVRNEDINDYKNRIVRFKIIEYDPKNRRIIGSIKIVKEEEQKQELDSFWQEIEIGKEYEGIVNSLSAYGAFVDLGSAQGLLHISEITWDKSKNVNDILEVGQHIKVHVIDLDKENRRIKLSYNGKGPDPWEKIENKYNINDIVTVKVSKFMPFGAFVELEPGIEGLVHISQIAERRIVKPEEELSLGQKVNAKIIGLDLENKKIEISIKEIENTSNEYKEEN